MTESVSSLDALIAYARALRKAPLNIRDAAARIDEDQEGDGVTRTLLLLDDPTAGAWDVDEIRELRLVLGRRATELGLPRVSLTLVPQSEADIVEPFARA